ncbi:hypothetical protein KAFR_0K01830 [Kazachstania africana CBS 2517]|uniref:Enoyl reductase (ER) domain-containing protein n=1 Tax=Kazachstania africana (strain ATCC 22294 / BCRC 22015 / CBS 2517 / CECT 1963 / NBRC 1671 / NRRL Y-8276) TaxID=1071382 RepID=H2B1N7_KAZAF|nr:hypothetical protein KAFR_0K01830 [Kazachstania africana CBS 2517]CCF60537.1 hypothetical protein KAFR_0K01830 [Kazachstania africana CBS 2517]
MADRLLNNRDSKLEAGVLSPPKGNVPKEIKIDEMKLERVARPLRNVKFIPTKALVFRSKHGPTEFSYDSKIKLPVPKNKLVVQVKYVGLNPIDFKIRNGYSSAIYREAGLGREYSGMITHVGQNLQGHWNIGDEVFGIFYHPHLAIGCLQTSILIDPSVDPILVRPEGLSPTAAAGSLYCLGTAFNILDRLERKGFLKNEANILINGGTSSVAMFTIQLLKYHYKVAKKLMIVTTGSSSEKLKIFFPDLREEMLFIDYLKCRGKSSKPLRKVISEQKISIIDSQTNNEIETVYDQGKFDIVLDFIGGYDILRHSTSLINKNGAYVTTVGDYVSDYKNDIYNSLDNPSANARKLFGSMLYSYDYSHFYFDPNVKLASKNDWINRCYELLDSQIVTCIVDKVYDWKDHEDAFAYMLTQRAQGKLILRVEEF